jgi:endoglucanase
MTPRRRLRRILAGALFPLLALSAAAETYIQSVNQNGSGDWNTLAHWNTNGTNTPTGTAPAAINPADHFVSSRNGWALRSPTGDSTFGGASLTLGGTHVLAIRSAGTMTTVPHLITRGTPFLRASYGNTNVTIQTLDVQSGTFEIDGHTSTTPNFGVTVNTLVGKGDLKTTSTPGGTNRLSFLDATSYQGSINVINGKVRFMTPVSSAGGLVAPVPADVAFDHDGVFTALTVNGTTYPTGTYNANSLGFGGPAAATVTVRASATWYLTTDQTGGHDWTQAFSSQWTAAANGTGASAPSINILDTYIHNVGSNALRTPTTSSVFLGGSLKLGGSAQLVLGGGTSAISTVPALATTGGVIVGGGSERNLSVDKFAATSGSASFTTTSGGVINLFVGDLVGAGNFTLSGAGKLSPFIDHANHYTGTITVNNGATLHVLTKFGIGGSLVVNTGGNVVLDDYAYVTALTVAGSVKPVGTYSATDLGAGFTGSGRVVVYTPDLAGPAALFGVNLAGAEFKGGPFWQTNAAIWDYYQSKGLTLIRMPFKWRHIQPTLNGAVSFTKLDECLTLARDRGMKVILDMHDYSRHGPDDTYPLLGTAGLPISAYTHVWGEIAKRYKNDPAVWGYDLMNEPKGELEVWADAAQQATDAIRRHDQRTYVLVEGMSSSSAHRWPSVSGTLDIKDPVGRLIYSAHSYWDTLQSTLPDGKQNWGGDGTYINNEPRDPMAGVNQAAPFVEWLQTRPYAHGNFGEYGIPHNYNSADWNVVLANFLQYLRDNNISGTYWAAGSHWGNYQLSCHPLSLTSGPERPQMSVLELFNNTIPAVPAVTYYQSVNQNGSGDWNTLAHWNTVVNGSGAAPAAITADDDFVANTNARILRTATGVNTFGGKSLTLGPATHVLNLRSYTDTSTIPNFITLGAAKIQSGYKHADLAVTSWLNQSGTTAIINHTHSGALFPLAIGTLTGSGNFNLTGSATGLLQLTVADATGYSGTITLTTGRLQFMNAVVSGGALVVANPGDVIANHAVAFDALTVAGTSYPAGTYSTATLGFVGTGSVTVSP